MDDNIKLILSNIPVASVAVDETLDVVFANTKMTELLEPSIVRQDKFVLSEILDIRAIKTLRRKLCIECDTNYSDAIASTLFLSKQNHLKIEISWKKYQSDLFSGWILVFYEVDRYQREIESLKFRATKDELTGAFNRWEFHKQFDSEIRKTKRYNVELSLAFIDVDKFKSVNDTYGHPAGDALLVDLAREIQQHLRECDVFARIGGDEFAVLMPNTNEEQAKEVTRRIKDRIANRTFFYNGAKLDVGISVGVASAHGREANRYRMTQRCDEILYQNKTLNRQKRALFHERVA